MVVTQFTPPCDGLSDKTVQNVWTVFGTRLKGYHKSKPKHVMWYRKISKALETFFQSSP